MEGFHLNVCIRADGAVRSAYKLSKNNLGEYPETEFLPIADGAVDFSEQCQNDKNRSPKSSHKVNAHILLVKPFLELLKSSRRHKKLALRYFQCLTDNNRQNYTIFIDTDISKSYVIDYAWGHRLWRDCHITLERECAAAWLSTLGGGFSALGDYSQKFAARALQTSLQQLWLSKRCHDESGVARGLLFLALALSQLGFGGLSRKLLIRAWKHPTFDPRHKNMCLGVQAKLKYDAKLRRLNADKKVDKTAMWNSIKTISIF